MGEVYDARQVSLNKRVALKLIRSGALATEGEVLRFRTEAEAAAKLEHPNIVAVYEIGQHEGRHYVSMRLVEGESLAEQIQAKLWRPGSGNEMQRQRLVAALMAKVARAVQHAHQRGVIHRDLKPGNILVDESGEPSITDFGLAKLLDGGQDLTVSHAVLGTPAYMAPEQAAGKSRDVTTVADIYGLGAVLYELLTGLAPFAGETPAEILEQVRQREPPKPRTLFPGVHGDLETICCKCLEKEPARRYGSAENLAEDLERWMRGEPIQARPVPVWERGVLWARRRPVIAALSGAVALSLLFGVVGIAWQWRNAEQARAATAHVNARLRLQRAEDLFASDNASLALAVLARAIRDDPNFRAAEERLVNALNYRRFLVPAVSSTNTPVLGDPQITFRNVQSRDAALSAVVTNATSILISANEPPLELRRIESAHVQVIRSIVFSPDNRLLASASADATAKIWNVHDRGEPTTLPHPAAVESADFSPENKLLATGCGDGTLRLWNLSTRQVVAAWPGHRGAANVVRFSPDGLLLATGGDDGFVRLWRLPDGERLAEPLALSRRVDDLRFSGDGRQLFVRVEGGTIREFTLTHVTQPITSTAQPPIPVPTAEPIPVVLGFPATNFHRGEITSTNLSPDGKLLVTASTDQTARVWDAQSRQPISDPLRHDAVVNCARFSADGLRLVTSTANGKLRLWDIATGAPLTDWIVAGESVDGAGFSADGTSVAASNGRAWPIHRASGPAPSWLAKLAEAISGLRITESGLTESVPPQSFLDLKESLPAALAGNKDCAWVQRLFGSP